MRAEAGKMPESLIPPIRNGHGVSDDRFGFKARGHIRFHPKDGSATGVSWPAKSP